MLKRRIGIAAVLAASMALSACAGSSNSGDEIVLGLIANTTGSAAGSYGIPFSNGVELALKEVASSKYFDGTDISFKVSKADGGSALNTAVTAYNTVLRDNASVVLSDSLTPISSGVSPLANDDGVVFITGSGGKVDNPKGYTFVFNDLRTPLETLGTYMHTQGFKRVVAIVDGDNPAFPAMTKATEAGFKAAGGNQYVGIETIATDDSDFSTVLTKVAQSNPDAVQVSALDEQAGNIVRQMRQTHQLDRATPVGALGWSAQLYEVAENASVGAVFPVPWAPGLPKSATFEKAYEQSYKELPNPYAAVGYQAVWAIAVAAKKIATEGGKVTSSSLREALPAVASSGELGQHGPLAGFSLDADGMARYPGVLATFSEDGSIKAISK